jgi:hypothetical protein
VSQIIKDEGGEMLIQVLDVDYIYRTLKAGDMPCMPDMTAQEAA